MIYIAFKCILQYARVASHISFRVISGIRFRIHLCIANNSNTMERGRGAYLIEHQACVFGRDYVEKGEGAARMFWARISCSLDKGYPVSEVTLGIPTARVIVRFYENRVHSAHVSSMLCEFMYNGFTFIVCLCPKTALYEGVVDPCLSA